MDCPCPRIFGGGFATAYLIGKEEMDARRKTMQAACLNCHDASWVQGQWARFVNTIDQTNAETLTGTSVMGEIWQHGFALGLDRGESPFDEAIEKKWTDTWLFYANTIRFASAMGCGGDYGVYADGRYHLSKTLLELDDWIRLRKELFPDKIQKKIPKD